jgi:uncharacterized linocin/CFP29 family protein
MVAANRAGFWDDSVWSSIDDGVTKTAAAIRVAQKVFPAVHLPNVTAIPADRFDAEKMSIAEGVTKPYIELAVQFPLTNGQVSADAQGSAAITVSKFAARNLALAEDMVILQGKTSRAQLPPNVNVESGANSAGDGLIGLAANSVRVHAADTEMPNNSGGPVLAAITAGIALLTKDIQAPPYALILDAEAFGSTWGSVINGAPASTVLNTMITGGVYCTGAMPPRTGLLIALGGDPTTIYIGGDPTTEPTHRDGAGNNYFRTFERIQYVARDARAFVRLDFPHPKSGVTEKKT